MRSSHVYQRKIDAEIAIKKLRDELPPPRRTQASGGAPRVLTLGQIVASWKKWHEAQVNGASPEYLREVQRHLSILAEKRRWRSVSEITGASISAWRTDARGIGVERRLAYLRSVLRWSAKHLAQTIDPLVLDPPRRRHGGTQPPPGALLLPETVENLIEKSGSLWPPAAALVHCLATYGARPTSYCQAIVADYDARARTLRVGHVKHRAPLIHPLFAESCVLLDAIVHGRELDEPLFVSPWNAQWKLGKRGEAMQLGGWYWQRIATWLPRGARGIYALKRYAISRMLAGESPWRAPLTAADAMLFTGHLTPQMVLRYGRTNLDRARSLIGER